MIVGFPPGGLTDNSARIVAQGLTAELGQPVVVENKAGADSTIAAAQAAKSTPDGYTLFYATSGALASGPALRKGISYDPVMSFAPLSRVGDATFILFVHPDVPAKTVAELVNLARANPGHLNYGSGSQTGIVGTAQLIRAAGIKMTHVPYKGDATLLPDLLAGRVQVGFISTVALGVSLMKEGRLRALAVMNDHRTSLAPEIPTLAEAGFEAVSTRGWHGIVAPAGLQAELARRLSATINAVLKRIDVRNQLTAQGLDVQGSSPEEFRVYIKAQVDFWRRAAQENGITTE